MKVFYSRISTQDGSQNDDRQLQNLKGFDYVFRDTCSGTIPLFERPKGAQIKQLIDNSKLKELHIHSIDRLGRDLISTMTVWKQLTELGIRIVCRNPNFQNLNQEGETDVFSELMISILSTMSDFERKMIRERQMEGIRIRKEKGLYSGRKVGTVESREKFLSKDKPKKLIKLLERGLKYSEIQSIVGCSPNLINKVKKLTNTEVT